MSKAKLYAQTLQHAFEDKTPAELDVFFEKFIGLLKQKKEHKLLPAITREYNTLIKRSSKGSGTTLIVRDAQDGEKYKVELAGTEGFDAGEVTVLEDKTIVGGFIAKNSTTMLDRSYKKGLVQMYKRLVK